MQWISMCSPDLDLNLLDRLFFINLLYVIINFFDGYSFQTFVRHLYVEYISE